MSDQIATLQVDNYLVQQNGIVRDATTGAYLFRLDELADNVELLRERNLALIEAAHHNHFAHKRLEAQIETLNQALSETIRAKTFGVSIPTATMEHEFQRHYRHGWENGVQVERERRIKLVNLLKEAVLCPEIGCSLSDDIKAAIVEAEKLK